MKKMNKKGFTIVELVVVIAVIAILAAVMIPTFSGVTGKANDSARDQLAKNAHSNYLIDCEADELDDDLVIVVEGKYYYPVIDGQIDLDGNNGSEYTEATAIDAVGFTGDKFVDADKYGYSDTKNEVADVVIYVKASGTNS